MEKNRLLTSSQANQVRNLITIQSSVVRVSKIKIKNCYSCWFRTIKSSRRATWRRTPARKTSRRSSGRSPPGGHPHPGGGRQGHTRRPTRTGPSRRCPSRGSRFRRVQSRRTLSSETCTQQVHRGCASHGHVPQPRAPVHTYTRMCHSHMPPYTHTHARGRVKSLLKC